MKTVLIAISTTDGHTLVIGERLRQVLEAHGAVVHVKRLAECSAADVAASDMTVVGASIRYGKHQPQVADFIARHQAALESRPNALFSVNVVARKPGKDVPEGNPYLQKFLRSIAWKPRRLAVFAGRIDYPSLRLADRAMIRLIMWITKGPTDASRAWEFTDWSRVETFGSQLASDLNLLHRRSAEDAESRRGDPT
jgi:menaquinone-dependent protoporphyrinogen oxidase